MWNFLINYLIDDVMIACINIVCKFHTYNSKQEKPNFTRIMRF